MISRPPRTQPGDRLASRPAASRRRAACATAAGWRRRVRSRHASEAHREKLTVHGLRGSAGRRGDPYDDNAMAASFTKTLEHEEVHLNGRLRDLLGRRRPAATLHLDEAHNARRLHAALGYLSPARFEEINARKAAYRDRLPVQAQGVSPARPLRREVWRHVRQGTPCLTKEGS